MKRYIYMIAALAIAVVGCSTEKIETVDSHEPGTLTVVLPETRVYFEEDGDHGGFKSTWAAGDEIAVETTNNRYAKFTLVDGAGTKLATFQGTGTPKNGGKAIYPAVNVNLQTGAYTLPSTIDWDVDENKVRSEVPMVGSIYDNGQKVMFDSYATGAVMITYDKIPLTTAFFDVTFTRSDNKYTTGTTTISGTKISAPTSGTNTVTVRLNGGSMLGGTMVEGKFLIPVPEGTIGVEIDLKREDKLVIGGSHYASKVNIDVPTGTLKVLPLIHAKFPYYTFIPVTNNNQIEDGTYVLVYEIDRENAYVNGDDKLREVLPAKIVTLNNPLYGEYDGTKGIVIDLADYETSAWIVDVSNNRWSIKTKAKGTLNARFIRIRQGFVELYVGSTNGTHNNIRYYTASELDQSSSEYSDPIWDLGGFIYSTGYYSERDSNIKLYKFLSETPES